MVSPVQAIKATFHYVKAGSSMDQQDYVTAHYHIERAMNAAGASLSKPSLFEVFLRAGYIERRLGNADVALRHVRAASEHIVNYRSLREADRKYLLDYCKSVISELAKTSMPRLRPTDYEEVQKRYKRSYPIAF